MDCCGAARGGLATGREGSATGKVGSEAMDCSTTAKDCSAGWLPDGQEGPESGQGGLDDGQGWLDGGHGGLGSGEGERTRSSSAVAREGATGKMVQPHLGQTEKWLVSHTKPNKEIGIPNQMVGGTLIL
jgi:hypothetical protein